MDISSFSKKALPHVIALIIFLGISIFMYRPIIFEGKIMDQNDINQGRGATSEVMEYRNETGEEAFWTNSMFSGMPTYLIGLRWSGDKILDIFQQVLLLNLPRPVGENFLAFLTFYILLLSFGVRPYLAMSGALAFGLSTFYVISIHAGHMWKIRAIAYMPLVLAGIRLIFTKRYVLGFVLTGVGAALEINANHPQITYYLFLLLLFYGVSEFVWAIKTKELPEFGKKVVIIALAGLLAIGSNFGKLWATYEYGKYSIRGKSELSETPDESKDGLDRQYAFRWSSGIWESLTLYIPHLYGGASGNYAGKDSEVGQFLRQNNVPRNEITNIERIYLGYWGQQPGTAGPAYAGAVIVLLFLISLFFVDSRYKYWMIAAIIFSIMLSWGKNFPSFNNLMFEYFPGYNKFRAVTMVIVIALTLIPLMGFLGLEKLITSKFTKETNKKLLIGSATALGIALIAWLFTDPPGVEGIQQSIADYLENDRREIIRSDVYRTIFYVVASFGLIYFYLKQKISLKLFYVILLILVALDLGLVDSRYVNDAVFASDNEYSFLDKTPADERILADEDIGYRVLNLNDPFNEARTSYFHHSIGGYHGAKLRRYQDLISAHIVNEIQQIIQDKRLTKQNSGVISMLNAKYLLAGYQENAVIPNQFANGTAWTAEEIVPVQSPDEEIKMIGEVDLSKVAVVDQSKFDLGQIQGDSLSEIEMIAYSPNELVYEADIEHKSLAVFSEIYYPEGWKAYVDGEETEILRANYVLRALCLEPGEHTIRFQFEPNTYIIGNKIMLGSSVMLLLASIAGIAMMWKRSTLKPLSS